MLEITCFMHENDAQMWDTKVLCFI